MATAASWKVPGAVLTIAFGVGTQSPLNAPRTVYIVDYCLSGGSVAAGVPTPIFSADDAAAKFGDGSHIHLGAIAAFKANPVASLYGCGITPSGGATARQMTITLTNNATANGAHTLVFNSVTPGTEVSVASGDTPTTQATAIAAAVNKARACPWSATSNAGVVTLTAKQASLRNSQYTIALTSAPAGTTVVLAETVAGLGETDPTTVLDAMAGVDADYIATGYNATSGTTGLTPFTRKAEERSGPLAGKRGCVVGASTSSYATAAALALAQNSARCQVAWCRNAQMTTVEMAAAVAVARAKETGVNPAFNFDGYVLPGWRNPATDTILLTEQSAGLNCGLTPIVGARIIRSITTRWQDALGNPDYRVLDTPKQDVVDFIADQIAIEWVQRGFNTWNARNDTTADGSDTRAPDQVMTPRHCRGWLMSLLQKNENGPPALLKNVAEHEAELVVNYGLIAPGRFDAVVPVNVIDGCHILDVTVNQIG